MNVFREAYARSIAENQNRRLIWDNYLESHKKLDLTLFFNKMTVPSLIPIGSRILFRGDLIHTNEVMVSLGSNYFVKCSAKQAEIIKQHRIKGAEEKLQLLKKENDYLENQLSFSHKNVLEEFGKEIIEPYNDDKETEWKIKHCENVRKHKQEEKRDMELSKTFDDELWDRFEELELKEELENECDSAVTAQRNEKPACADGKHVEDQWTINSTQHRVDKLKSRLSELKNKGQASATEEDLFKRLDQLDEQEALEEELDRLENYNCDVAISNDAGDILTTSKKSISFASDYENNCIEIHFKHSDLSPITNKYNKTGTILTPSDIYIAFPENFKVTSLTSIMKKTEYSQPDGEINVLKEDIPKVKYVQQRNVNVIGEIMENTNLVDNEHKIVKTVNRPPSKFKTMRMQKLL